MLASMGRQKEQKLTKRSVSVALSSICSQQSCPRTTSWFRYLNFSVFLTWLLTSQPLKRGPSSWILVNVQNSWIRQTGLPVECIEGVWSWGLSSQLLEVFMKFQTASFWNWSIVTWWSKYLTMYVFLLRIKAGGWSITNSVYAVTVTCLEFWNPQTFLLGNKLLYG